MMLPSAILPLALASAGQSLASPMPVATSHSVVERGYLTDGERHMLAEMLSEAFQHSLLVFRLRTVS